MTILVPLPKIKDQRPKLNSQRNPSQIFSITLLMIYFSLKGYLQYKSIFCHKVALDV